MTENQKKLAIIVGTIVIALFLLFFRKSNGTTIVNQQGVAPINVSIPGISLPDRSGTPIVIPGLPSFTPYSYNAISPCMCNGGATNTSAPSTGPAITNVYNAGNSGGNVYNYSSGNSSGSGGFFGNPNTNPGTWFGEWVTG